MGIKRVVDTDFWNDDKVIEMFSPEDKLFMLYLLTNPHTTQLGIYQITPKHMGFELGYTVDSINVLIDRFENKYGFIKYSKETREIAIKNFLRHSIVKGGAPVRDCLARELKQVKNKELISFVFSHVKQYENVNETVKDIIAEYEAKNGEVDYYCDKRKRNKKKSNDNDNDNDNDVSYHESYHESSNESYHESSNESYHESYHESSREIVSYLNEKAGTSFRSTGKDTQKHIKARLNDGFTIDDFKIVIDKKVAEWKGTEWEKYLRPSTLFGSKFEGYLNAKNSIPDKKASGFDGWCYGEDQKHDWDFIGNL